MTWVAIGLLLASSLLLWRFAVVKGRLDLVRLQYERLDDDKNRLEAILNGYKDGKERVNRSLQDANNEIEFLQNMLSQCSDPSLVRFRLSRISSMLSEGADKVPARKELSGDTPTDPGGFRGKRAG